MHFDGKNLATRASLDLRVEAGGRRCGGSPGRGRDVGFEAEGGRGRAEGLLVPLGPGGVASLVGMPFGLAVVAKRVAAPRTLALDFGARCAARSDDGVGTVGARAPPRVRVGGQETPEH